MASNAGERLLKELPLVWRLLRRTPGVTARALQIE